MSRKKLTIRAAVVSDKAEWLPLWNQYLEFYDQNLASNVTDETWRRFFSGAGHRCIVAIDSENHAMIGFATYLIHASTWTLNGYCYLEDLFVDPMVRGRGAGRQLIEAVIAVSHEANISRVYWHTQDDNLVAQGLYDKVATKSNMIQYRHLLDHSLRT